jgi:hypothetical protein
MNIKDRAELDFEITAPLMWLAPKINKGYVWLRHLKIGSKVALTVKTRNEIIKWEDIWIRMSPQEQADIRGICSMKKTYGKLSKKGKWQFLKEIKE